MKIYTRTGDDGTTGLIGGRRVAKDYIRLEAYGTIDELNAVLALCSAVGAPWNGRLRLVHEELFVLGSHLAAPEGPTRNLPLPPLPADAVARFEREIDAADEQLPPLKNFVLPGGSEAAARLHMGRCVCRRAERLCVALARVETVPGELVIYLNRMSDWLFAMARLANHEAGVPDVPWLSR